MSNKALPLLIIFLGLPSFMFTGANNRSYVQTAQAQYIDSPVTVKQRELREIRVKNNTSVDYLKYKMKNHDQQINPTNSRVLSKE